MRYIGNVFSVYIDEYLKSQSFVENYVTLLTKRDSIGLLYRLSQAFLERTNEDFLGAEYVIMYRK